MSLLVENVEVSLAKLAFFIFASAFLKRFNAKCGICKKKSADNYLRPASLALWLSGAKPRAERERNRVMIESPAAWRGWAPGAL